MLKGVNPTVQGTTGMIFVHRKNESHTAFHSHQIICRVRTFLTSSASSFRHFTIIVNRQRPLKCSTAARVPRSFVPQDSCESYSHGHHHHHTAPPLSSPRIPEATPTTTKPSRAIVVVAAAARSRLRQVRQHPRSRRRICLQSSPDGESR